MKTTRRTFIGGIAAASVPTVSVAAVAVKPAALEDVPENPGLLKAYQRFLDARSEQVEAKDALEWLVDEWRHLWPLAPEAILNGANVDEYSPKAERDIAGRIVVRDTADLTQRLTRKQREEMPTTSFSLHTEEEVREAIILWGMPRTARNQNALARKQAEQVRMIARYQERLRLIEEYTAETRRVREASGVELVKQRIKTAQAGMDRACADVSHEPAHTVRGLMLKAEVLQEQDDGLAVYLRSKGGALGGMARFIDATLGVIGRAST